MLAWGAVVLSAGCSGAAVVLQTVAARRLPGRAGLRGAAVRLLGSPAYLAALALVATGFLLAFAALRGLPVFVVQAGRASSLAVAALLAVPVLGARLRPLHWCGLAVLAAGLVGLGLAVTSAPATTPPPGVRAGMVAAALVLAAGGWLVAARTTSTWWGVVLAAGAGLGYGLLALGARLADLSSVPALLADPAAWAAGLGGALGLALTAVAVRRAPVMAATATTTATETAAGAVLGVLLAGDRAQPGLAGIAAVAVLAVLAGALTVATAGAGDGRTSERLSARD